MNESQNNQKAVPKRVLTSLLASVSAGVVPREGAPYIAIGRRDEIAAILSDLELVNDGGGAMRFLIGRYGSGKSFLIQLIRGYALERDFITMDADLSPERRLYGAGGSGVATYRELMKNMASKSSPDGGALPKIMAKWITKLYSDVISSGGDLSSSEAKRQINLNILEALRESEALVGGFDFSRVVSEYFNAHFSEDEEHKSACLRWLRGEFATKTEACSALGFRVSVIIDDNNWYDFIKLWAMLVRKLGYRGLVVFIDECVNLYKISHKVSRENNYEKILSMFNDTLQGKAPGLQIIFGGTPQFLEDTRRGLFSYEALKSRLCDSKFMLDGYKNLIGPVIRLRRLTDEELYALICRITVLHEQNYSWKARITDEEKEEFLRICLSRAGANTMITPREMLRDYMTVLNILLQNPDAGFDDIVKTAVTLTTSDDGEEEIGVAAADPSSVAPKNDGTTEQKKPMFTINDLKF